MRITCGSPVYLNNERVGYVCGLRINAAQDRVSGLVIGNGTADGSCRVLDFEHIEEADSEGVVARAALHGTAELKEITCSEEQERMRYWLSSLVPNARDEEAPVSARFTVVSERERGDFTLAADKRVSLDGCGCGSLTEAEVDAQGYVDHVVVRIDEQTGATAAMRPVPKQSRERVLERGHSLQLA